MEGSKFIAVIKKAYSKITKSLHDLAIQACNLTLSLQIVKLLVMLWTLWAIDSFVKCMDNIKKVKMVQSLLANLQEISISFLY